MCAPKPGSPGSSGSPSQQWKSTYTASSASSTFPTAPTITAGCWPCWRISAPPEAETGPSEQLAQQQDVQGDDHCHATAARDDSTALVDVAAHHVAPAGQDDQRNQRERDAEGQHGLAEHQGAGGVG